MPESSSFERQFIHALRVSGPGAAFAHAPLERGVAVHRNTVLKGLVDALADNYPTVERLVGREWFVACASEYAQAHPPTVPMLALYGAGFADFLARPAAGAELPYLPEVARIDRLWTEAHFAREASLLTGNALAQLKPEEMFDLRLALHPAARLGWFQHSAVTIWLNHRPPAVAPAELNIDGTPEGALLTRPRGTVECVRLDATGYSFLSSVSEGATLGVAATTALEQNANADIASQLSQLIAAGAFGSLENCLVGEAL